MSSDVNLSNKEPDRGNVKNEKKSSSKSKETSADANIPVNCPWKIDQKVEACDNHGNWYPAKILDIKNLKLLIHFQRWSSRFDEWFDMDSDLIRKIKEPKKGDRSASYKINDEVLARWSDGKFYPARIIKLFNDSVSCHVLFYDGYKKKVKLNAIERMPLDYEGDRLPPKPQPKETFAVVDPSNHNQFVCGICKKGFRKESLLTQHKKHYHNIVEGNSNQETQTLSQSVAKIPEMKEETKIETDKINLKTVIKIEINDNNNEQPMEPVFEADPIKVDLIETTKKRKSRDIKKPINVDIPLPTPKRPKTETNTLPPSTNPYFYYHESKSSKKSSKTNFALPFDVQNVQQITEAHENDNIDEIVKCICPLREDNGLMVQCELCLSWQHALCMGFTQEGDIPSNGYVCSFCRNPPKAYKSQKNSYQLSHWLKNALDPVFLPSHFTPIIVESSIPILVSTTSNNQQKIIVKQESDTDNVFDASNVLMPSASSSMFESYFPNTNATSFLNQSTITTTTTAANHNVISSVSDSSKASAVSLGPFMGVSPTSKPTSVFDLPPSSGLFPSTFLDDDDSKDDKKTFVLHDFTNHALNNNSHLNLDDDHLDNLMDMNMKSDYFGGAKLMDEDDTFASHVKATNMLSSALLDIMNNIRALNYKIANHKDVISSQIIEKQQKLKENLRLIEAKLEKIEKEIELKDSYAIHTSSSTLTATSPENFGFSDINNGIGLSSSVAQTTPSYKTTFPASLFESNHNSSSDHLAFQGPNSAFEANPTLSSLVNMGLPVSPALDPNFYPNLNNKLLSSTSTLTNLREASLASIHLKNDPPLAPPQSFKSLPPLSLTTSSTKQDLARLYIPPGSSNSNDEQELIENHRPSMTHEYLPINLSDGELKLEISYHYKDLSAAKEIMLSLK